MSWLQGIKVINFTIRQHDDRHHSHHHHHHNHIILIVSELERDQCWSLSYNTMIIIMEVIFILFTIISNHLHLHHHHHPHPDRTQQGSLLPECSTLWRPGPQGRSVRAGKVAVIIIIIIIVYVVIIISSSSTSLPLLSLSSLIIHHHYQHLAIIWFFYDDDDDPQRPDGPWFSWFHRLGHRPSWSLPWVGGEILDDYIMMMIRIVVSGVSDHPLIIIIIGPCHGSAVGNHDFGWWLEQDPVNYAKDWLGQSFLILGQVWFGKGFHLWMSSLGAVNNHFPVY